MGKIFDDGTREITDVVIPHQTSTGAATLVPTYEHAIQKAKSKGEIVGTVFYNGPHDAFFSQFQLTTLDLLHTMQKVPKFSVVMNKQKKYLYRAPEE